jgi:hypothetical protein
VDHADRPGLTVLGTRRAIIVGKFQKCGVV